MSPRKISKPLQGPANFGTGEDHRKPAKRVWLWRALAMASPLILLALVELALRVAGYGYPASFFIETTRSDGEIAWRENHRFAHRFFPPALAREPWPALLPIDKDGSTFRVFVLGESAAMGDPEPAFGLARHLEAILSARYPDTTVEVINAAVTAINSHAVRSIAHELRDMDGDAWVVYMGNNEVVGPYGAGTVFGKQTPPLWMIRLSVWTQQFRLGQLGRSLLANWTEQPAQWEGMEMFLDQQVARDDPRMAKVYSHFRANLEAILQDGVDAGVQVIACSVASNLQDSPPFASAAKNELPPEQREELERLLARAARVAAGGRLSESVPILESAQATAPGFAQTAFQLGRVAAGLGATNEALVHFLAARDLDVLRFRADSGINDAIKQRVEGKDNVIYVDSEPLLNLDGAGPGAESFLEHVHFTFSGAYRLALSIAKELRVPAGTGDTGHWPSEKETAAMLGWTDWNEYQIRREVQARMTRPPFTHQEGHAKRLQDVRSAADALARSLKDGGLATAARVAAAASEARPDDWILLNNAALIEKELGEFDSAIQRWERVATLIPHRPETSYQLGAACEASGDLERAAREFERALELRPGFPEALHGMGLVAAGQGRHQEAVAWFDRAVEARVDFPEAWINRGVALAQLSRFDEAAEAYEFALELNPFSPVAHMNLGRLAAAKKDYSRATNSYNEALAIEPDNAVAHYNYGNALTHLARIEEALTHYLKAIELDPVFAEARYNAGLHLVELRRYEEAEEQFASAAALRPNDPGARLNLALTLTRLGKWDEAIRAAQAVLERAPDNGPAQELMRRLEARMPNR